MQLMQLCQEIFTDYGLGRQLWLRPYRIVSTGSSSGLVQVLTDALSLSLSLRLYSLLFTPTNRLSVVDVRC